MESGNEITPRKLERGARGKVAARDVEVRTIPGDPPETVATELVEESKAETEGTEPRRKRPYKKRRKSAWRERKARETQDDSQDEAIDLEAQMRAVTAQTVPLVFRAVSAIINRRYPDRPYTYSEATELTAAMIPVALKHGQQWLEYLPEVSLLSVCVAQFVGRSDQQDPTGRDVTALAASA